MPERQKVTRRVAIGSMALATAGLVIEGSAYANDEKRLLQSRVSKLAKKRISNETLEEFFWQNAISHDFTVVDYSWLESNEPPPKAQLVLTSVSRIVLKTNDDARPEAGRPYAISLLFDPKSEVELQPASYLLVNEAMGEFDLLLSKTTTESGSDYYEAILN